MISRWLLCSAFLAPAPLLALDEVPFVVTPDNVTLAMLELAKVGPDDYVIDLGSGDGRIVILAAKKFGARGLGVEIVSDLVKKSRESAKKAGVEKRAEFREQDLFRTDLARATVVTMYLLPDVNLQLRPSILGLRPGTRIVSHDWDMADWKPDRTITVAAPDKTIGLEKSSKVHYWVVPARVEGTWCGTSATLGATRLELKQHFQEFAGFAAYGKSARDVRGRVSGRVASTTGEPDHPLSFELEGDMLKVTAAAGRWDTLRGAAFQRSAREGAC